MTIIAVSQIDIVNGDIDANIEQVIENIHMAGDEGSELVVFPELCLSGYQFELLAEVEDVAISLDNPVFDTIQKCCQNYGIASVIGFIEKAGDAYYNTAAVIRDTGRDMLYRKIHLPSFGADQFIESGNLGFPVFDLHSIRIGINICYDQRFPESARLLALQGADVIVVPTRETDADHPILDALTRVRAYENRVYYILANRVGSEFRTTLNGLSRIIDPMGDILSIASMENEEIIFADIDVSLARNKHIGKGGNPEMDLFADRIPANYQPIISSNN